MAFQYEKTVAFQIMTGFYSLDFSIARQKQWSPVFAFISIEIPSNFWFKLISRKFKIVLLDLVPDFFLDMFWMELVYYPNKIYFGKKNEKPKKQKRAPKIAQLGKPKPMPRQPAMQAGWIKPDQDVKGLYKYIIESNILKKGFLYTLVSGCHVLFWFWNSKYIGWKVYILEMPYGHFTSVGNHGHGLF